METILAELFFEQSLFVHHGGEVVKVSVSLLRSVFFDPGVQFQNLLRRSFDAHVHRVTLAIVPIVAYRHHRGQHHANPIGSGQLRHRSEIPFGFLQRNRSRVPRNVVRPRQNHYNFGLQRDRIRAEAHKHLRRCLPADASVDVRLPRKETAESRQRPHVCDGVAHEDHAPLVFHWSRHLRIGFAIAREIRPVFQSLFLRLEPRLRFRQFRTIRRWLRRCFRLSLRQKAARDCKQTKKRAKDHLAINPHHDPPVLKCGHCPNRQTPPASSPTRGWPAPLRHASRSLCPESTSPKSSLSEATAQRWRSLSDWRLASISRNFLPDWSRRPATMLFMKCPGCGTEMTAMMLNARLGKPVTIDVCAGCQAFWFDHFDSLQLSAGSTLKLMKYIGEHSSPG